MVGILSAIVYSVYPYIFARTVEHSSLLNKYSNNERTMETIIVALLKMVEGSSGLAGIFISVSSLIIGGWLFFRKTNIEEVTSVGTLQQKQITSLLEQIQFLSEELTKARHQLAEIHEQNVNLMQQVRDSNQRMQELERLMESNKRS